MKEYEYQALLDAIRTEIERKRAGMQEPAPAEPLRMSATEARPEPQQAIPEWTMPVTREVTRVPEKVTAQEVTGRLGLVPVEQETPWYQTALETVAKPFTWAQEHLEKPWAATLWSAATPELSWLPNESWLEHEKREYEAWKPWKFVKGVTEFSMPLWWIPYFGWSAKGAGFLGKALGISPKIAGMVASAAGKNVAVGMLPKGILATEKALAWPLAKTLGLAGKGATKIIKFLPIEKMRADLLVRDRWRLLAEKIGSMPGGEQLIKAVNPSALAGAKVANQKMGLAKEALVLYNGMTEAGSNMVNAMMGQVDVHDFMKMFGIDRMGRALQVSGKRPGLSMVFADIVSNLGAYNLTKQQGRAIKVLTDLIDESVEYGIKMGVKINKKEWLDGFRYFPRVYEGKTGFIDGATGIFRAVGTANEPEKWIQSTLKLTGAMPSKAVGKKAFFQRTRIYEYM